MKTLTIPSYTAIDEQVEAIRRKSMTRYGIPYTQVLQNTGDVQVDDTIS